MKFFTLREENGDYIQDVKEMTRVPVILKTDLTKSPPYVIPLRSLILADLFTDALPSDRSTPMLFESLH